MLHTTNPQTTHILDPSIFCSFVFCRNGMVDVASRVCSFFLPWKNLGTNQAKRPVYKFRSPDGPKHCRKSVQKKTPHSRCTVIFTTCVAAHNVQTLWENSETDRAERLCSSRLAGFVELLHVLIVLNLLTGNDTILSDNSFCCFLNEKNTICFHLISILLHFAVDVRPCCSRQQMPSTITNFKKSCKGCSCWSKTWSNKDFGPTTSFLKPLLQDNDHTSTSTWKKHGTNKQTKNTGR